MTSIDATAASGAQLVPLTATARDRLLADARLIELSRGATVAFELSAPAGATVVAAHAGEIGFQGDPTFGVRAAPHVWARLLAPEPKAGDQNVHALCRDGEAELWGDSLTIAQHLHLLHRVIEVARSSPPSPEPAAHEHRPLEFRGQYVRVDVPGLGLCDIYVERAGTGTPLLCLPTAGSDTKQYHGLVTETDLTERYELIAFDLPWHGKSNPAWGRRSSSYRLDSAAYVGAIAAVTRALALPTPPILLGVSMAGAAVVEAVATHPELFAGAVACQAGPRVAGRRTPWLRHAAVNQALHIPEWTSVLMAPQSPAEMRDRVWWGYSQGGFGAYDADIGYYSESWDVENVVALLDDRSPLIVVLSGAYDTSVPTAASQELAETIPNSRFRTMPELGHFPHAENPTVFAAHLEWALHQILG